MGVVESIGEFGSQNVNAGEKVKDDDAEPMGGGARERESGDSGVMEGMMPEEILKRVFTKDEEAYEAYKEFGKYHGFGVRKGDCKRDEFGNVTSRRFFCNREGLREAKYYNRVDRVRAHKAETRTNCQAKFSIFLDKTESVWRMRKIDNNHNHELTPHGMVHLIPKYRSMTVAAKDQINGLNQCGISTAKAVRYMAGMAGGYPLVGFLKKDAYNYVDKKRRESIADGDAEAAIAYLEGKTEADPMAMAVYNMTEDGMLGNLFWADGRSRLDYQYFGDVLAFDSTYKKNKYNRPLVIFSRANNHKQTTIFGFGVVMDETIASYTWLLEKLLEVMCGRQPSVVVTDGDESMRKAICEVFPSATHRLCAWHFEKNVTSNVKEVALRERFNRCLFGDMTVDEFLMEWSNTVEEFGLEESLWANQVFYKKEMWVNAYLREKFCACIRTTSRCEGVNAIAKNFLQSKGTLLEIVQNLELMVKDYRNNELLAQFRTIDGIPVMTTSLESLERDAAETYTKAIFGDVRLEIERVAVVNLVRLGRSLTTKIYTLEDYGFSGRNVIVLFDINMGMMKCSCGRWCKNGYPCRHMFFVMKSEHLKQIPRHLILKRWTRDAKSLDEYVEKTKDNGDRSFLLCHGALHTASQWLFFLGAQKFHLYEKAMKTIRELCAELERECAHGQGGTPLNPRGVVRDPNVAKTKGAPKYSKRIHNKRLCTECKNTGHNKRKCPDVKRIPKKKVLYDGAFEYDELEEAEMLWSKYEFEGDM